MKLLHLLVSGHTGGIEVLMKHYAAHSVHENHFVFLWDGGAVAQSLEECGHPVSVLDIRGQGAWRTLRRMEALYRQERFDAVVTHHRAPFLKLALLYLKWRYPGIRAITYAHSNAWDICEEYRKEGLWLRRLVHRAAFLRGDGIVAISESVKQSLVTQMNIPPQKITVIYNGIPVLKQPPAKRKNEIPVLIYVGRLAREKGVQNTLCALKLLPPEMEYRFDIVGSGPDEEELRHLTAEYGLTDRVRFLGVREDVPALLCKADVFVHAPDWEEGFGLSVLEAMAAGCVCVCTDRGAMAELIIHGVSGYLADPEDPCALARQLETVLRQDDREALQAAAYARAKDFSVERFTAALDAFVEGVAP